MFKKIFNIFSGLLLCCCVLTVHAVVVSSLYSAQMPVASHSFEERSLAISKALQQTLVKVSGYTNVAAMPKISEALKDASHYVSEFSYTSVTSLALSLQQSAAGKSNNKPWLLHIRFSSALINQLLSQAGLAVWTKNRHLILIWAIVKDNKKLSLIANDSANTTAMLLSENALNRGLPMILPILDLTDLQKITPVALWEGYIPSIKLASARYNPDAVLIVRIDASSKENIIGRWLLLSNNEKMLWEINGSSMNEIIQAGIGNVAGALARKYGVLKNNTGGNKVFLTVTNLQGVTDYAKLIHYLNGLAEVADVELLNISPTHADFELNLSDSVEKLMHDIRLGALLQPISDESPNSRHPQNLYYKLKGNII